MLVLVLVIVFELELVLVLVLVLFHASRVGVILCAGLGFSDGVDCLERIP